MNLNNYRFVIILTIALIASFGLVYAGNLEGQDAKLITNADEKTYPPITLRHGGPDGGGYYYIDSNDDANNAPVYNWVDIIGPGTPLTMTDDSNLGPFSLGFNFTFYGQTFNSIRICSNGWASFTSTATAYFNAAIPGSSEPNNLLAPFWDDLNPATGGMVYYYADAANRRFIITWNAVPGYNRPGSAYTFQIIIQENGHIFYQYNTMTGIVNSATVGIENGTGTIGTQYIYNQDGLTNGLAVYFGLDAPVFGNHNVGPTNFLSPGLYGQVGDPISPQVVFKNVGQSTESFPVRLIIREGANELYNQTSSVANLPPNGTATVTFPNFTPSTAAIFSLIAISELSNDENRNNDTLRTTFRVYSQMAYYDFEANGVFTPDGIWEWGAPTSGPGNAHSGANVWATVLAGNYPNSNTSSLITTPFGLGQGAILNFWHWYDTEARFDGCNVKISTDNGATWELLHPMGGYDNEPYSANPLYPDSIFTGHNVGQYWQEESFDLSAYAGMSVLIRFDFGSDGSIAYPGWYIDDLMVLGGGGVEPGYLTGTVRVSGTGVPIQGAVVNVSAIYDTTGADGRYSLLLYPGTYTATATAQYHNPASAQVTISENDTTVQDFNLTTPQLSFDASPINISMARGTTRDIVRTMQNTGDGPLDYRIDISYGRLRVNPVPPPSFAETPVIGQSNPDKAEYPSDLATLLRNSRPLEPPAILDFGDELAWFDLQNEASDNQLLGVVFAMDHFWVSGGAQATDPNHLYKFNRQGILVETYNQNTTGWGWLDLAWDGEYIYGTDFNTDIISQIDPTTGQIIGTVPNPTAGGLGLAYDPATDHFWGCNWFGSPIIEFTRQGTVVNTYPQAPYTAVFGLAWDNWSPGGPFLWAFCQDPAAVVAQFNPATGSWTGVTFNTVNRSTDPINPDLAAGCEATVEYDPSKVTLLTLIQGNTADGVGIYELAPYTTWLEVTPPNGTIPAGGSQPLTFHFDLTGPNLDTVNALNASVTIDNTTAVDPVVAIHVDVITGIDGPEAAMPAAYSLSQNYPNPFNARTEIRFSLPVGGKVDLSVYNLMGQKVATLVSGDMPAGNHAVNFDASALASGIYYYKLNAGSFSKVERMTLVK